MPSRHPAVRPSGLVGLCLLAALSLGGSLPAIAAGADPGDPAGASAPLPLSTALRQPQPGIEMPPGDWREANRRVQAIGGWRAYAREAAQAARAEAARHDRPHLPAPGHSH